MPNAERLNDLMRQVEDLRAASLSMAQQYDADRRQLVEHVENMALENNSLRSRIIELQELVRELKLISNAQQEKLDYLKEEREHFKRLYRAIYEELHGERLSE